MAKKPKSENYDALGSIFDFIFSEADKPVDKRKPIKPTGVSGDKEFTNAVFAALEKPGVFVSNTVIDEFNGALDYELATVKFDEFGKVKVSSNSLIDILRDPGKAVNDEIKKRHMIRKSQRAKFLGAAMDDFINTAWVHKYGNLEAKAAIRAGIIAKESEERYKVAKAMGEYAGTQTEAPKTIPQRNAIPGRFAVGDKDFMANRSLDLLGRKTFGELAWSRLSNSDKDDFTHLVSTQNKFGEIQKNLVRRFSPVIARNFESATRGVYSSVEPDKEVDIYSPSLYKALEEKNLRGRIGALSTAPAGSPQEKERRIYEKTLYLLNRDRDKLRTDIGTIRASLRTATTSTQKKELRKQLKDAQSALRVIDGHTLFGQIGKWEGYLNSLNTVWGPYGSNVIPSILNGSFYDKNRNTFLLPVSEKEVGGVKIFVTREEKGMKPIIKKYNSMGANLYYATPRSVMRTLFYNGEGFAYLLHRRLNVVDSIFNKWKSDPAMAAQVRALKALGVDFAELEKGINGKVGGALNTFINTQLTQIAKVINPNSKDYKRLARLLKSSKTYRNLTHSFSGLFRLQKRINEALQKPLKKMRVRVARWLMSSQKLRSLFVKTGASKLLGKWIAGEGLHVLLRSLVTAVAGAVGIAGTPVASIVIGAVTWVVTDLAMRVVAFGLNIFKWALIGIVGVFFFVFGGGISSVTKFNKVNYASSQTIPGTVVSCTQYEEQDLDTGWDDEWGDSRVAPPPSGEQCIMGTGNIYCTQGYRDTQGWSHQNMASRLPVDLVYISSIYAPQFCELSKGNCFVTRIAKINCGDGTNAGGIVEYSADDGKNVHHFKLLHVQPYDGVSEGTKLFGGQAVAHVQTNLEQGWCWTGTHLHLETTQNGVPVDPLKLLQGFNCNVPDETGCADP